MPTSRRSHRVPYFRHKVVSTTFSDYEAKTTIIAYTALPQNIMNVCIIILDENVPYFEVQRGTQ